MMQLSVTTLTGKTIPVILPCKATVEELKIAIEAEEGG